MATSIRGDPGIPEHRRAAVERGVTLLRRQRELFEAARVRPRPPGPRSFIRDTSGLLTEPKIPKKRRRPPAQKLVVREKVEEKPPIPVIDLTPELERAELLRGVLQPVIRVERVKTRVVPLSLRAPVQAQREEVAVAPRTLQIQRADAALQPRQDLLQSQAVRQVSQARQRVQALRERTLFQVTPLSAPLSAQVPRQRPRVGVRQAPALRSAALGCSAISNTNSPGVGGREAAMTGPNLRPTAPCTIREGFST